METYSEHLQRLKNFNMINAENCINCGTETPIDNLKYDLCPDCISEAKDCENCGSKSVLNGFCVECGIPE
jgi:predicted Zn-ribbon and HTH transcriptional regulator